MNKGMFIEMQESMARRCHNHRPQINPSHLEEERQNTYSHTTARTQSTATRSLFLGEMISKLARILSTAHTKKPQAMGATINTESTNNRTNTLGWTAAESTWELK